MRHEQSWVHYLLGGALFLGVCADFLFFNRWLGISAVVFVGLGLVILGMLSSREGHRPTRANFWLAGVALFFAGCLAVREAPLLTVLNLTTVVGALLLFAAHYQGPVVLRLTPLRVIQRTLHALGTMCIRPLPLAFRSLRALPINTTQMRRLVPLLRGLLLAFPVLLCFGGLLVAADQVFASYIGDILSLKLPFDVDAMIEHGLWIGMVTYVVLGGLVVALQDDVDERHIPAEGDTQPLVMPAELKRLLGSTEALTVLVLVDVLFGGFMLVQAAYFFGGMDTLNRTGMTYAAYARRGFFELLIVTGLSLLLLLVLALITRRQQRWQQQAFNAASSVLIVLMLGLLASAFQRMLLYEHAYGYTRLRLYTLSFMLWLAVLLIIVFVALLRDRLRWVMTGGALTALIYLALLNVMNPDAMIVRENIARYQSSGKLDIDYLVGLSADAVPELVSARKSLDATQHVWMDPPMRDTLTRLTTAPAGQGWPSWHLARAQARQVLQQVYGSSQH